MNSDKINFIGTLFQKHPKIILCIALCILTIAAYRPVKNYPFINFDDNLYVYNNNHVKSGLSIQNILWAFSLSDTKLDEGKFYWHPLTWVSHMIDVQLFGVDPHMHHVSNLFFHTLNTLLLFMVFYLMTRQLWKCFFVAALFALHPINIESVAWIAERKNLLFTTFWMSTMLAYIFYAKRPSIPRYLLLLFSLALGLLAKPYIAVLPCVLLLMDYWPMERMKWTYSLNTNTNNHDSESFSNTTFLKTSTIGLILEKIPLLLMSFAAIRVSMLILHDHSQVLGSVINPLSIRIENAFVSYVVYLYKMIWPVKLAVFYPFPDSIPLWQSIGAFIFLIVVTGFFLFHAKTKPYLIIGWLWFLGVLFPTIGLIQVSLWPALADRFAYVPFIGIFIILAWGIPEFLCNWHYKKPILFVSAACVIIILFFGTRIQLGHWTDTYTLFNRAIAVTKNNAFAYNVVADELASKGDDKSAEKYFLAALAIKPDDTDALKGLGQLAFLTGDYDNALHYYQRALKISPSDAEILKRTGKTYYNLGLLSSKQGKLNEALDNYKMAISMNPQDDNAYKSLADLLFSQGDMIQALKNYSEALQITPDDATTHYNIGVILYHQKKIKAAQDHFYQAVQIDKSYEKARIALTMTRNILESEKR